MLCVMKASWDSWPVVSCFIATTMTLHFVYVYSNRLLCKFQNLVIIGKNVLIQVTRISLPAFNFLEDLICIIIRKYSMFCLYIVDAVLFILFKFGFGYYADKKKIGFSFSQQINNNKEKRRH